MTEASAIAKTIADHFICFSPINATTRPSPTVALVSVLLANTTARLGCENFGHLPAIMTDLKLVFMARLKKPIMSNADWLQMPTYAHVTA